MQVPLIAWDSTGAIVVVSHVTNIYDPETGDVVGPLDTAGLEAEGYAIAETVRFVREERGVEVPWVTGAGTWPEWLDLEDAQHFKVEFEPGWSRMTPRDQRPDFRVRALVHRTSGHRRERKAVDDEMARRIAAKRAEAAERGLSEPEPADIRDLVGGPGRPLRLDVEGRTVPRPPALRRPDVPILRAPPARTSG